MNLVIGYFYDNKKMELLNSVPKRDMVEFMESFCLDYVAKIQGNKVNRIDHTTPITSEVVWEL